MKRARIYTDALNRIIAATKGFTNQSSKRIVCRYIRLDFDAEHQTVTAIAVDGYRLTHCTH